ncbi:MAG: hypothetical protein ACTSUE_01440 [Promethearchaeota archaeon]
MKDILTSIFSGRQQALDPYMTRVNEFLSARISRKIRYSKEGITIDKNTIIFQRNRYQLVFHDGFFKIMKKHVDIKDEKFINIIELPKMAFKQVLDDIMILTLILESILHEEIQELNRKTSKIKQKREEYIGFLLDDSISIDDLFSD